MRFAGRCVFFLMIFLSVSVPFRASGSDRLMDSFRLLAEGRVAEALGWLKAAWGDRAEPMAGRAWLNSGDAGRAEKAFESALRKAKEGSSTRAKALFGLAECRARKHAFAEAERLFRRGLEIVLSERHRARLVKRLRLVAAEKLDPERKEEADPASAEKLLRAALELAPAGRVSDELTLEIGKAMARQGNREQAAEWLADFAGRRSASPLAAEALLRAARYLLAAGRNDRARRLLSLCIERKPPAAIEEEATFLLSRTWGFPEPASGLQLYEGLDVLSKFLARFPRSVRAAKVRLEMALAPLVAGHPELAAEALRKYLAASAPGTDAGEAHFQLARSLLLQGRYMKARAEFERFIHEYPQNKHWLEARQRVVEIDWRKAVRAFDERRYGEAAKSFEDFAVKYSGSEKASEALLRAADCLEKVGKDSRAESLLRKVTTLHEKSPEACRAWYRLGIHAERRQDFRAARKAYRNAADCALPDVPAAARLLELDEPAIHVAESRVFRASERPRLELRTRNISRLTVKIYPVDSEDYFRDRLSMDEVTSLDIALCQPEATLNVPVKEFAPHKLVEQKLALPLKRPGLYLVSVAGGGLEATSAVRYSDLDIALRRSGHELFVFAQDMRRSKPLPGVRLVVSDGDRIVFSGKTGRQGIWKTPLDREQGDRALSVLASHGGHVAWAGVSPQSFLPVGGEDIHAVLITDRPAYRPAETVHAAGFVREDRGRGAPSFRPGEELELLLRDTEGLVVERRKVVLDDYGMFSADFVTEGGVPEGPWSLQLVRKGRMLASTAFQVLHFRLPGYRLEISLDREVVVRGQALKGVILVRHPGGFAVRDQLVQYGFDNGSWKEARTGADGKIEFVFPPGEIDGTGSVSFVARLPEHNLEERAPLIVADREFEIRTKIPERMVAGQPAAIELRLVAPDGSERSGRVEVELVHDEQQQGGGERVMETVLRKTVEIGTGGFRLPFTPKKAGSYLVRALATDGFGNPVFTEDVFRVERGDEFPVRFAIDRDTVPAGGKVRVRIDSRLDGVLALLTAETDRVLEYEIVRLRRGANELWFAEPGGVGKFGLHLTAMYGVENFSEGRDVEVDHELKLKLRADARTYHPGDEVTLTLVATDAAGRPVDAGVVLAVVDEKLFSVYPENLPNMLDTFAPAGNLQEFGAGFSNGLAFPPVDGVPLARPEVTEAEGSAAMAALSRKRRALTSAGAERFEKMAGLEQRTAGVGGMGIGGAGAGGGGYGRAGHLAKLRTGAARVSGRALLRRFFALTAAFFPNVRTGPDGVASVSFRLPHALTSWRVAARAVGRRRGAGERFATIVVEAPAWVELVAPEKLVAGDAWSPAARVFNNTRRELNVTLGLTMAGKKFEKKVRLGPLAQGEFYFPEVAVGAGLAGRRCEVELEARAGAVFDHMRRAIPVEAAGYVERIPFAGLLEGVKKIAFDVPEEWTAPRLVLRLDPALRGLMLLERIDSFPLGRRPEFVLLLEHVWRASSSASAPEQLAILAGRLRRALVRMCRLQRTDGSFSWARNGPASLRLTARAVRALGLARKLAPRIHWTFPGEKYERSLEALSELLKGLKPGRQLERAEVLYSLASAEPERVPVLMLDRLHRLRGQLPLEAKAMLGLAWHSLGRTEKAAELAALVRREFAGTGPQGGGAVSDIGVARGLQLLATVEPQQSWPARAAEKLWASACAARSRPALAEATAAAFGAWLGAVSPAGARRLELKLDGKRLKDIELSREAGPVRLELAAGRLGPGRHELELRMKGSGVLPYLVELSGHRLEPPPAAGDAPVHLSRLVEPVPQLYKGHEITAGFDVAEPGFARWDRPVERVPAGGQVEVTIRIERKEGVRTGPLILLESIPSGFAPVAGSAAEVDAPVADGGRLLFLLPPGIGRSSITYRLRAMNPGRYRFRPLQLLSYYGPPLRAHLRSSGITVDVPGARRHRVKATPDEMYQRGRVAFDAKDWRAVVEHLEPLFEKVPLKAEVSNDVLDKLLQASIELGDAERMVRYFELAKEKNPDLLVPFERIRALQDAYRKLGAHEAGFRLARGVAEATLLAELQAVGALVECDELAEALQLFGYLVDSFPDGDAMADALYSFGQVIFERADRARKEGPPPGFDRAALLDEVARLQARFAGLFPDSSDFPAAVYSLASALLERGRPGQAAAWCGTGLRLRPGGELSGELEYLRAFSTFRNGDYDGALEVCRDIRRRSEDDESKRMATYIMAQIYHARGRLEMALPLYRQVADYFRDAAETLEEMKREVLRTPPVVTVAGGRPELEVTARNIDRVNLRVFRIDPMRLLMAKESIEDIGQLNLSGIRPVVSRDVGLSGARAFKQASVRLPLKKKGAYLVILRGGSRVASSLVFVDGLRLVPSVFTRNNGVRLQVLRYTGEPASGARVAVKDAGQNRVVEGKADLRGIFVTDGISGPGTIVTELNGAWGMLLPEPEEKRQGEQEGERMEFDEGLLEGTSNEAPLLPPARKMKPGTFKILRQNVKGVSVKQAM